MVKIVQTMFGFTLDWPGISERVFETERAARRFAAELRASGSVPNNINLRLVSLEHKPTSSLRYQ